MFTHVRVTPQVSGDLQERSCCSLPLAVTLFGFTPSLSFRGGFSVFPISILLLIRGDASKKVRLNDEVFGLSVKSFPCEACDVGEDTVITMLAQSTGPCCMFKWLFDPGLREKVYLNHLYMCVCVRDTFQRDNSAIVLQQRGQRYFCPPEGRKCTKPH